MKKKAARKTPVKNAAAKKTPVKKAPAKGGRNYKPKGLGNGGARKGSGRKLSAATKRTRAIADKLAADGGILPLDYLLGVMRETLDDISAQYKAGEIDTIEFQLRLSELTKRRDNAAEKCLSFFHPRLASITAEVGVNEHENWLALMESQEQ